MNRRTTIARLLRIVLGAIALIATQTIASQTASAQCDSTGCNLIRVIVDANVPCRVPITILCNDGTQFVPAASPFPPNSVTGVPCPCGTHGGTRGVIVNGVAVLVGHGQIIMQGECCWRVSVTLDSSGCVVVRVSHC
jgi:hypothetical protein